MDVSGAGPWRKSSHSGGNNDCVELAWSSSTRFVRDSKNPSGPVLGFSPKALAAFLAAAERRSTRA